MRVPSVVKTFVRGVTAPLACCDRTALACAGITATIGVVAGPGVAAAAIVGTTYIGRAVREMRAEKEDAIRWLSYCNRN